MKLLTLLSVLMMMTLGACAAFAGLTPPDTSEITPWILYFYEAFTNGHTMVMAGAVVSALTWAVDRYGLDRLGMPDYLLPVAVAVNALLAAMATAAVGGADQATVIAVFTGGIGSIPVYDAIRGWMKEKGWIK